MNYYSDSPKDEIRNIRQSLGLNLPDFANKHQVDVDQLTQWENGIGYPTYRFILEMDRTYQIFLLKKPEEIDVYHKLIAQKPLMIRDFTRGLRLLDDQEIIKRLNDYDIKDFSPKELSALLTRYQGPKIDQWLETNTSRYTIREVTSLFPFLKDHQLNQLADQVASLKDMHIIFPFLTTEKCDTIGLRCAEDKSLSYSLHAIAPFLSNETLNKIVLNKLTKETSNE